MVLNPEPLDWGSNTLSTRPNGLCIIAGHVASYHSVSEGCQSNENCLAVSDIQRHDQGLQYSRKSFI